MDIRLSKLFQSRRGYSKCLPRKKKPCFQSSIWPISMKMEIERDGFFSRTTVVDCKGFFDDPPDCGMISMKDWNSVGDCEIAMRQYLVTMTLLSMHPHGKSICPDHHIGKSNCFYSISFQVHKEVKGLQQ